MLNASIQIEVKPQSSEMEDMDPQLGTTGDFEIYALHKRKMYCKDHWGKRFLLSELDFNHMLQNGKIAIKSVTGRSPKPQPMPLFAGIS